MHKKINCECILDYFFVMISSEIIWFLIVSLLCSTCGHCRDLCGYEVFLHPVFLVLVGGISFLFIIGERVKNFRDLVCAAALMALVHFPILIGDYGTTFGTTYPPDVVNYLLWWAPVVFGTLISFLLIRLSTASKKGHLR